jgi:hypothetical protein
MVAPVPLICAAADRDFLIALRLVAAARSGAVFATEREDTKERTGEDMHQTKLSVRDATAVQQIFKTTAVTVGGLYLTTHSVTITAIGTGASMAVTCWFIWTTHRRPADRTQSRNQQATDPTR